MNRPIEKIILDIIKKEMGLPSSYTLDGKIYPALVVGTNNALLGRVKEIQVSCQSMGFIPIANNTKVEMSETTQVQKQYITGKELVQIDIMSRNDDAFDRKHEVILALSSIFADYQQENHQFQIGKIPASIVNVSGVEGGSNLKRFSITINCITSYTKTKENIDFYNSFSTRVDNYETINNEDGLIEFTENNS